jgi:hypothetical protein
MNRKCSRLRLLVAVALATLLALSATSLGADTECIKECHEEHRECIDICNKYIKDPGPLKRCKEEGCRTALDECINDCKKS